MNKSVRVNASIKCIECGHSNVFGYNTEERKLKHKMCDQLEEFCSGCGVLVDHKVTDVDVRKLY